MDKWIKLVMPANDVTGPELRLLPGDGVAVGVKVVGARLDGADDPEREVMYRIDDREMRMTLLALKPYGFVAEKVNGEIMACRWDQLVSYCRRHAS